MNHATYRAITQVRQRTLQVLPCIGPQMCPAADTLIASVPPLPGQIAIPKDLAMSDLERLPVLVWLKAGESAHGQNDVEEDQEGDGAGSRLRGRSNVLGLLDEWPFRQLLGHESG